MDLNKIGAIVALSTEFEHIMPVSGEVFERRNLVAEVEQAVAESMAENGMFCHNYFAQSQEREDLFYSFCELAIKAHCGDEYVEKWEDDLHDWIVEWAMSTHSVRKWYEEKIR